MDDVRPRGKLVGLAWLGLIGVLAFGLAAGFQGFVRLLPVSAEKRLGRLIGGPKARDCAADRNAAFTALVARIYPLDANERARPIVIHVLDDEQVNAMAYLGDEIYLLRGLITEAGSAEEVAAVLAHEIEHVEQRHVAQALASRLLSTIAFAVMTGGSGSGLAEQILHQRFSIVEEEEADRGALARLRRAGVDRRGFVDFFRRQADEGAAVLFSDHPGHRRRMEMAEAGPDYPVTPVLTKAQWRSIRRLCR